MLFTGKALPMVTEEGIELAGSSSALSDGSRGFPYTGGSGNSREVLMKAGLLSK